MNSIDRNQEEKNRENLNGAEAIEKMKELIDAAGTCFFLTKNSDQYNAARPMSVQTTEDDGTIWFMCANDSSLYEDVSKNSKVELYFQGSSYSNFLSIHATARINTTQEKIDELWEPSSKNWFTEGKNDPRIALIEVKPLECYYWDNKHGNMIAGLKMLIGTITGKTMDDSIQGSLNV